MSDSNADLKGMPIFFGKSGQANFHRLPNFLIDTLMDRSLASAVPASFWKMTWVIWRHIMTPSGKDNDGEWVFDRTFKTSAEQMNDQHGVGPAAYMDWTLAYYLSGVFKVTYGKGYANGQKRTPTVFTYYTRSTVEDWMAFIGGLNQGLQEVRRKHIAHNGKLDGGYGGERIHAKNGFALCLCFAIADARKRAGLSITPYNNYIEDAIKAGTAERSEDGTVSYTFVKRSLAGVNFKPKDSDHQW